MADESKASEVVVPISEMSVPDRFSRDRRASFPVKILTLWDTAEKTSYPFDKLGLDRLVTSVKVEENVKKKDSKVEIELFDPDGSVIESEFVSEGVFVQVVLGYYQGEIQDFGTWMVQEITPSFKESLSVTLRCQSKFVRMTDIALPERWDNITASQFAQTIALRKGLTPVVTPTYDYLDINRGTESEVSVLKKLAGMLGYEFFIRGKELHFHPASEEFYGFDFAYRPQDLTTYALKEVAIKHGKKMRGGRPKSRLVDAVRGESVSNQPEMEDELDAQGRRQVASLKTDGRNVLSLDEMYGTLDPITGKFVVPDLPMSATAVASGVLSQDLQLHAAVNRRVKGIEVTATCAYGLPTLRPGKMVNISGIGVKYTGAYYLNTVSHAFSDKGLETSFVGEARTRAKGKKKGASTTGSGFDNQIWKQGPAKLPSGNSYNEVHKVR